MESRMAGNSPSAPVGRSLRLLAAGLLLPVLSPLASPLEHLALLVLRHVGVHKDAVA